MSDFLGDLVSKSLGIAPILRPRPMSRFEPWRADGTFSAVRGNLDAALDAADAIERVEAEPPALKRENDTTAQARSDLPSREPRGRIDETPGAPALQLSSSPESKPELTLQTVLAPTAVTPQPMTRERDVSHEMKLSSSANRNVTFNETHTPTARPSIERIEHVIVEHEGSARDRELPAVATSASSEPIVTAPIPPSNASDAKSAPRPVVTPIIERIERIQEIPDRDQVARLGPAQTPQPLTTPPGPQPSAPPTIHVTIGRIEVRATPPSTPAKRASQPAPKMSLEEYLRSRSGDRR